MYVNEQRNLQLMKENTEAQLQLLAAQVHPHFLFNTLNNIFSQVQIESPKSSKMIMEYINLEKIRYGNKLDLHYQISDKTTDLHIAPLLLLPFIENYFKHGASNMLENPWMNLSIEVNDTTLVMKLMNRKANPININRGKMVIGINNVRQRLELLYKDKMVRILVDDIVYIESAKDYVIVFTTNSTIITRQTISSVEAMLSENKFFRIHRSFIVSLDKIHSFTSEIVEIGNKELPIGRFYRHSFLQIQGN